MFETIIEKLNELLEDYEEEYEEMDYADLLENFLMLYCNGDDTTILDIVEENANMNHYNVYILFVNVCHYEMIGEDIAIASVIDKQKLFRLMTYFLGKIFCDNKMEQIDQQMILDQQEALNNIRRPRSVAG